MADMVTKKKLEDADIDVDNLGKAANELGTVNPRYGNPYKTAPQTIQDLQQKADQVVAQGFYQGYATEALLLAAKPAVAEMRARADDTRKIYRWNRTSAEGVTPVTGNWVDTGLSDLDLAKLDATTKANAAEFNANSYTDTAKQEAIDAALKADATDRKVMYGETTPPGDLVQIQDDNFNMLFRVDKDKKAYISGMTESLQDKLNVVGTPSLPPRKSAHRLSPSALSALSYLPYSGLNYAPCPMQLLPQMYTVSDTELQKLSITETPQQLTIDTPYGLDDKVVHPSIVECYGSFRGYRYLMIINPYTSASIENPLVYGSNDLVSFELLDGFVQPLAFAPAFGFLSDPCLSYDPINGEIVAVYTSSKPDDVLGNTAALLARTTRNGYDWSDPFFISDFEPTDTLGKKLSPALIYNPKTRLFMYWTNDNAYIKLWTSPQLRGQNWTQQYEKKVTANVWHIDVKYIGDKFLMVASDSQAGSNYRLLTSTDGYDWVEHNILFPENLNGRYKASALVELEDSTEELSLFVIWTDLITRKIFTARTNKISYQELV